MTGSASEETSPPAELRQSGLMVRNIGEPIKLAGVNMHAVLAKPVNGGAKAEVWRRLALTSDDPLFHRIIEHLDATITFYAREAGSLVNLKRADTVLLVIRPDDTAELWVDELAPNLGPLAAGKFRLHRAAGWPGLPADR